LRRVLGQSVRWLCALMTPLVLVGVAFAVPAMTAWLGADNGPLAGVVLQVLLAGLWLSSLSMGPMTVVQAAGDLRHVAMFYLLQVPLLLAMLWAFTEPMGIVGAALAIALRQGIDTVGILWLAVRQLGLPLGRWRRFALGLLGSAVVLVLVATARSWAGALMAAVSGLGICAAIVIWLWFEADERRRAWHWVQARWRRAGAPPGAR
jgi:O-antigen/teichoic acid export membrane protein